MRCARLLENDVFNLSARSSNDIEMNHQQSHPKTFRISTLMQQDNLERFIVGRQFLVVSVIFVISICGAAIPQASVFDFIGVSKQIYEEHDLSQESCNE